MTYKDILTPDWVQAMRGVHRKYRQNEMMEGKSNAWLKEFLEFRIRFLEEEMRELKDAEHAEDVVDALIDLCVVSISTLDLFGVDCYKAWDEVWLGNMSKLLGEKPGRPNPLGLPDLTKPADFVEPCHEGNVGMLSRVLPLEPLRTSNAVETDQS